MTPFFSFPCLFLFVFLVVVAAIVIARMSLLSEVIVAMSSFFAARG